MASVQKLERVAAVASLAAGAIHGILVREHLEEWWGYGLFFAGAALGQLLFGLALLTDAVNPRDMGPRWARVQRVVYGLGLAANAGLVVLYAVTRTRGIPFFGPEAGTVEPVTWVGLASKACELVAIGALVLLLRAKPAAAPTSPS